MNRIYGWSALWCAALLLAACGGGGSNFSLPTTTAPTTSTPQQTTVSVPELAAGSYVVSTGDANAPTVGKYYAAADGSSLLVLNDANDKATQTYRREAKGSWVAVPAAAQNVNLSLLQSNALPDVGAAVSKVAGHYRVMISTGSNADFTVAADGSIVAGRSSCQLTGKVSEGKLPNTLKVALAASGCDALPASASGVIALDSDYAPAGFRLVADDGSRIAELWAYAD